MNRDDRFQDGMAEAVMGELATTYGNLCRAFGEPEEPGEGWEKTRVEWVIRSPFGLLIIGHWDQHDAPVEELNHWFVSGQFRPAMEGEEKSANVLRRGRSRAGCAGCNQLAEGTAERLLTVGVREPSSKGLERCEYAELGSGPKPNTTKPPPGVFRYLIRA